MRTMAMMQTHCKMRIISIIHIIYIKEKAEYKLSFISMVFPRLYFLYILEGQKHRYVAYRDQAPPPPKKIPLTNK